MPVHRLYFSQHGLAASKDIDPDRGLTEAGERQTHLIAKQLAAADLKIAHIFHSGKTRARQSAEIFTSHLKPCPANELVTMNEIQHLSPNDNVTLISEQLQKNNALFIGHLPHLNKLVSYLITGDEDQNIIHFQNSAVICLEKLETTYQLKWYITPELLSH